MNTEELTNKMDTLFPQMTNANAEGNTFGTTSELWKGVADKATDTIASVIAPVKNFILDVQPDLQVRNPEALPVVQVEVISGMGGAIVDNADWNKSEITNKYVDVKLHRISRPFMLTGYDLMRGERVETKVAAAMKEVAQGVVTLFMRGFTDSAKETISKFDPETAATISGAFGEMAETDTLLLDPANYAKIVPTNALALNPNAEGTYGIGHIYKSSGLTIAKANAIALTKDAVAGAVATPEIVQAYNGNGQGMQYLGEIAGIPMVLISTWDYDKQAVKCSVETMAGFTITDASKAKAYTVQA